MTGEQRPETLRDAHAVVATRRPRAEVEMSDWLRFHQANARMYQEVSDVDRGHHPELRYWVSYEERKADPVQSREW